MKSFEVRTNAENTDLTERYFPTREEAEKALAAVKLYRPTVSGEVCESREPANTTFAAWNAE